MDIFTTQLTRVVPVTIQPEKLKVKALLKGEPLGALKDDMKELTPSDYAFYHNASQKQQEQGRSPDHQPKKNEVLDEKELNQEQIEGTDQALLPTIESTQAYNRKMLAHKKVLPEEEISASIQKEKNKHLDIFV